MSQYVTMLDPKINVSHVDLYLWFSVFDLYLQDDRIFEHIALGLCVNKTKCLTQK